MITERFKPKDIHMYIDYIQCICAYITNSSNCHNILQGNAISTSNTLSQIKAKIICLINMKRLYLQFTQKGAYLKNC